MHNSCNLKCVATYFSILKAHQSDPLLVKGMDVYAALLAKEKKVKELEWYFSKYFIL